MKKLLIASAAVIFLVLFIWSGVLASNMGDVLLFLNWGEYIDETMIDAFEDEYGITVKMSLGESNEIFYSKVSSGTTVYDVVCPSDYMVEKMYYNDYLEELDFTKIDTFARRYAKSKLIDVTNEEEYNEFLANITSKEVIDYMIANELRPGVQSIYSDMNANLAKNKENYVDGTIDSYFVPYLWGTWGNMYTTSKKGLEEAVTQSENEWACLFDRSVLPSGTKVAMYDSHQHAYYATCKYLNAEYPNEYPADEELGTSKLSKVKSTIKNMDYNAWGTDNIKKDIVAENLDLGFMWTGDFLYYYAENASNVAIKAFRDGAIGIDDVTTFLRDITNYPFADASYESNSDGSYDKVYNYKDTSYEIGFDFYIPEDTIAFCDNLVVTKDSRHKDIAYDFINFMMNYGTSTDEEGNLDVSASTTYTNTYYVCYDAPYNDIYDALTEMAYDEIADWEDKEDIANDALTCKKKDMYDSDLYWYMYDYVTGIGFEKYYEKDTMKGNILAMFDRKYIQTINTTFNNARV